MTITREQLELAAKAAGIEVYGWPSEDPTCLCFRRTTNRWNPEEDHGQLLDLAMACKIRIDPLRDEVAYSAEKRPDVTRLLYKRVDCQDFNALAEAVITAAAEHQLAKEKKT